MRDRRYVVVILDSHGRSIRRVPVMCRSVFVGLGLLGLGAAAILGLGVHGLLSLNAARESRELVVENAQLATLLGQLGEQLPPLRLRAQRIDFTFAQVWAKSGLGAEPRVLGVGPVDGGEAPSWSSQLLTRRVIEAEPVALPFELERVERDARLLHQSLGEQLEYFHDAKRLLSNTPSVRPTNSPWITSSFGKRRDPIFGVWMMHKGLDLGGRMGMEVFSPADGTVIFAGTRGGYGRTIVIDHGYGLQTHFAHLSAFRVSEGERVRRGDIVALMGSTGKSTGPHLHYEVRRWGQPLDPGPFILD